MFRGWIADHIVSHWWNISFIFICLLIHQYKKTRVCNLSLLFFICPFYHHAFCTTPPNTPHLLHPQGTDSWEMETEIPLWKSLSWNYNELADGTNCYSTTVEKFATFLKQNRADSDVKPIITRVVWTEIKRYHDIPEELAAAKKVTLSAVYQVETRPQKYQRC